MLKLKSLINVFWVMTILFCYYSIDSSTPYAFNSPKGNENVIVDQCPPQDSMQGSGGVSKLTGDHNYTSDWSCKKDPGLKYDTANSHETIDRNGSAALFVTGNNGPFTWSVSGVGFTLEKENEPTGPTNTLYADGSACGAATIKVIGCDGEEVKGYVRCTTGGWGPYIYTCGSWCGSQCNGRCIKTVGKYRYEDWTGCVNCTGPICSFLFDSYDDCLYAWPGEILDCTNACSSTYCGGECYKACTSNRYREWICY